MSHNRFYSLVMLFTIFILAFSACAPAVPTATQAPDTMARATQPLAAKLQ